MPEVSAGLLSVFYARAIQGLCDEWEPGAGGNRVLLLLGVGLTVAPMPAQGAPLLPETRGIGWTVIHAAAFEAGSL
ncbi:hypothetical protein [Streptomyces sp. NPDC002692]